MTSISLDGIGTGSEGETAWRRVTRRLRVLVRAHRIGRRRAARMMLIRTEMRDPRWFADIGVDMETYHRREWLGEMARSMGGRL